MEFTLVQEGLTPLSADLMEDLARSIEVFFFESASAVAGGMSTISFRFEERSCVG